MLSGGYAGEDRAQRIDREKQQKTDGHCRVRTDQRNGQPRQDEHDGENRAAGKKNGFLHGQSPFGFLLPPLYHNPSEKSTEKKKNLMISHQV
jgi:hypothetical protein